MDFQPGLGIRVFTAGLSRDFYFCRMSGEIEGSWRDVVALKEQEWRDVLENHVNSLEMDLNNKEKELIEEKRRFDLLRKDFEYNLQLISERDEELEKFDSLFCRMKEEEAKHNAQVSELLIALDRKLSEVEMEKRNHEDLRLYYQQRLKEKELEGEQWRLAKEAEMKAEREDCDRLRRRLQQQISDLSVDLEDQRRELNSVFEEALKKKEHDFQSKFDELHTEKVSANYEVKQLRRELELVRVNQQQTAGELENECGTRKMMEKRIKELQWEVSDVTSMKDAELADLQSKIKQLQKTVMRCQEELVQFSYFTTRT
jgi:chromosome segregation ATPase